MVTRHPSITINDGSGSLRASRLRTTATGRERSPVRASTTDSYSLDFLASNGIGTAASQTFTSRRRPSAFDHERVVVHVHGGHLGSVPLHSERLSVPDVVDHRPAPERRLARIERHAFGHGDHERRRSRSRSPLRTGSRRTRRRTSRSTSTARRRSACRSSETPIVGVSVTYTITTGGYPSGIACIRQSGCTSSRPFVQPAHL